MMSQLERIATPLNTLVFLFLARILQANLRTVCLPTDGDALQLKPGHNLGVDLPIIKEQLDENKALLRGVSTNKHACVLAVLDHTVAVVGDVAAAGKSFNSKKAVFSSVGISSPW